MQDGLFRFWYRYVPKYRNFINTNQVPLIWAEIEADLPIFTSITFEEYCRDWVFQQNLQRTFTFLIAEVGSWWGTNPLIHKPSASQEEVDIVGVGTNENNLLLGECKWRNQLTDKDVLEKLVARSDFFPYGNKQLAVFSKSEYTDGARRYAKQKKILLFSFSEMQATKI